MPSYLIHGTDEFRIAQRVDELSKKADLLSEINLHRFDLISGTGAFAELVDCAFTPPFMGGNRLIVAENLSALEGRGVVSDGEDDPGKGTPAEIASRLAGLPDSTFLILFDRMKKLDGRGKLYKCLAKICKVEEIRPYFFDPLSPHNRELEQWLLGRADAHGVRLTQRGLSELALRLGNDLRAVEMEMAKFRAGYGEDATVDAEQVADLTPAAATHTVFSLCDSLGQGRLETAMEFLRAMLAAKSPAPYILTMLARHVRNLAIAREIMDSGGGIDTIQEKLKMRNRWVFDRFLPQAKRFRGNYARAHAILMECDDQLKTSAVDPQTALEVCVARLSGMIAC